VQRWDERVRVADEKLDKVRAPARARARALREKTLRWAMQECPAAALLPPDARPRARASRRAVTREGAGRQLKGAIARVAPRVDKLASGAWLAPARERLAALQVRNAPAHRRQVAAGNTKLFVLRSCLLLVWRLSVSDGLALPMCVSSLQAERAAAEAGLADARAEKERLQAEAAAHADELAKLKDAEGLADEWDRKVPVKIGQTRWSNAGGRAGGSAARRSVWPIWF
jgi:hypothetical protein